MVGKFFEKNQWGSFIRDLRVRLVGFEILSYLAALFDCFIKLTSSRIFESADAFAVLYFITIVILDLFTVGY